jgi:hypothetical protein
MHSFILEEKYITNDAKFSARCMLAVVHRDSLEICQFEGLIVLHTSMTYLDCLERQTVKDSRLFTTVSKGPSLKQNSILEPCF